MKWNLNNNPRVDLEKRKNVLVKRRAKLIQLSADVWVHGTIYANPKLKRAAPLIKKTNQELTLVMKKLHPNHK